MTDGTGAPEFGLDDEALWSQPTIYDPKAFSGQTVLVSGGAGGIGRAAAWLFGRCGAAVILAGRSEAKLAAAVDVMAGKGLSVVAHTVDIREPDSVADLFGKTDEEGGFDILINSAGGQFPQAAIDFSVKGWNTVINTNLNGTWHMMQGAARAWRDKRRPGSITTIVVVRQGLYGVAHTIAARSGVIGLTQALAVEWAPLKIRLNCIAPGVIETPGWRVYDRQALDAYPKSNPMMRNGSAWEVAEACGYLAGPGAAFVTGEVLHVAGGSQLWGETWTTGKPDYFKV